MEISALSAPLAASYIPRPTQGGSAAEQARQVVRDPAEVVRRQESSLSGTPKTLVTSNTETLRKESRQSVEAKQSEASSPSTSPRVQFKDSEGTRVMEVYDSKNILIYQVPPKGTLMLIRSQENQPGPQVETSA